MKSIQTDQISKILKSYIFKLLLLDLLLVILFRYYQPLCEPCLNGADCPPCLSNIQYCIIFIGTIVNVVACMYYLIKVKNKKPVSRND